MSQSATLRLASWLFAAAFAFALLWAAFGASWRVAIERTFDFAPADT